jgi:hypothetical protein
MSQSNKRAESPLQQAVPTIVLGVHGSGTSLATRLLMDMGLFMGLRLPANTEAACFQHLNRSITADPGPSLMFWGTVKESFPAPCASHYWRRSAVTEATVQYGAAPGTSGSHAGSHLD